MNENPLCEECVLHKTAKHVCMKSEGGVNCKLAIFLDNPNFMDAKRGRSFVSESADFIRYCLKRMSIDPREVYLDYIVKCYPNKGKLPGKKAERMACVSACSQYRYAALDKLKSLKAMVVLGSLGCETITMNKTVGEKQGAEWKPASLMMQKYIEHVWVGYSPGMLSEKPAEAGTIFRVIWAAAEEAGLNPVVAKIKPYEFPI